VRQLKIQLCGNYKFGLKTFLIYVLLMLVQVSPLLGPSWSYDNFLTYVDDNT